MFCKTQNHLYSYLSSVSIYRLVILTAFLSLFLNNSANANFESTDSSSTGSCPINHKMYYIGASAPTSTTAAPVVSTPLNWTAGNLSNTFTFNEASGSKIFKINFSSVIDLNSNYGGTPPFYGTLNGVTTSALNLVHNSPLSATSRTNHVMDVSINRPTSKVGYKIQDIDSVTNNTLTPYIEQVDVSANSGQLTYNSTYHTINANRNIVTGRKGLNCGTGGCTIDANWNYTLADIALNLKHNNTVSETNSPHAVGYSDFYFCLAPPKLIVKKALSSTRVNTNDQFEIVVSGGSVATNSFTTTGTGSTIANGTSATLTLAESTSYTITERVMNGTILGDIASYNATYTCNNATTGSATIMPSSAMTYNASAKTRSFALSNVTYGDEITCTITNTPSTYTFSGIVFDDNGGITATQASATNADITNGIYANNSNYFNGIYNPTASEAGISGSTIKLVNCANTSTIYGTQAATGSGAAIGQYQISVSSNILNGNTSNLCLIEERTGSTYPLRTNDSSKTIAFSSSTYDYPNNNFGRVIAENVALVLRKYQYLNDCPSTLTYTSISETSTPNTGFSTATISNIEPGRCIAYKISATNRANVNIDNFIMRDTLQQKGVSGATVTSVLANPALSTIDYTASDNPTIGANGEVKTKTFVLGPRTKRDFYFNTKYGTTQ